jgi:hypothetical protein
LQLGINYRGSSLAREENNSSSKVHAGDRAPDVPCSTPIGTSTRLFDVFRGPHFTLLAFGPSQGPAVTVLNQRYGSVVYAHSVLRANESTGTAPLSASLFDTDGHAHRAYEANDGMLILVRPDGYVGFIAHSHSINSVHTYLDYLIAQ